MEREIRKRAPRKREQSEGLPDAGVEGETKARGTDGAPCKSCNHPKRELLEQLALGGNSWREIERAIATGDKSVDPTDVAIHRHVQKCIPEIMRRRMDDILGRDEITADLVKRKLLRASHFADTSTELAFEEDEHGATREAAQGRSAAIRTQAECARTLGELIGMFQTSKIEMLIKSPEAQAMLTQIVEAICSDCVMKVRAIIGEENS